MINIDFNSQINELLVINGLNPVNEINTLDLDKPSELQTIEYLFKKYFDGKKGFVDKTIINEYGLFIHISNIDNLTVYQIKTEDIHTKSPSCYNSFQEKFLLSQVLLTECALWLFHNISQHKIAYLKTVKGLQKSIEDSFSFVCKSQRFALYKRKNSYVVTKIYSSETYFVAASDNILEEIKLLLKTTKPKKEKITLKSDTIQNLTIKGSGASGKISLMGKLVKVELDTELEFPQQQDYKNLIAQLDSLLVFFTDKKANEYKMHAAKDVIDCVYEQDNYLPTKDDYEKLYNDLILKDIFVTFDTFVLTFKANKTFKGYDICLQVNYPDFDIEEVTINE